MKYGLIGEKLGHSFSAQIHKDLFDYTYDLKELSADEFRAFMCKREFSAVNVTIPYKEAVIPLLDVVDDTARQIGAVNTVVNRDGKLYGYNTDFDGLYALIVRSGITLKNKRVLILGSGGTSKTAIAVAKHMECAWVRRVSRSGRDGCISYEQSRADCADAQVIINTTPCGMYPRTGVSPISLDDYPQLEGVIDVVYNPLRTKLVCDAIARGIPAVGGLYMLVMQAARAAEHFVGMTVSESKIVDIYRRMMGNKENIVLIGMPACGKSTVGKYLATVLNRPFIDTDARIEEKMGCTIPALFSRVGESGFRDYETDVIGETALLQGAVIATGGGAILRHENVQRLQENGRLYFLDRSLERLAVTSDRPLSSTSEDLYKRFEERYPLYSAACDVIIPGDGTVCDVANRIREDYLHEHFGDQRP